MDGSESVEWRGLSVESSSERVESVSDAIVVSSPTAQLHTPRVQMMLVQLLQRAAHTPEELLLFVSELGTAGLLSPDVVTGLCRDAGVGVGMLNAIRSGASGVDMNAAAATAASGGRSLFQALPGSSGKSLSGAGVQQQQAAPLPSPYSAATFGLGLSIDAGVAMPRDRLSSEFCDFQKIGQACNPMRAGLQPYVRGPATTATLLTATFTMTGRWRVVPTLPRPYLPWPYYGRAAAGWLSLPRPYLPWPYYGRAAAAWSSARVTGSMGASMRSSAWPSGSAPRRPYATQGSNPS